MAKIDTKSLNKMAEILAAFVGAERAKRAERLSTRNSLSHKFFQKWPKAPLFVTTRARSARVMTEGANGRFWGCFITQIFKNVPKHPFLSPSSKWELSQPDAVLLHKSSKIDQKAPFCHPFPSEIWVILRLFYHTNFQKCTKTPLFVTPL